MIMEVFVAIMVLMGFFLVTIQKQQPQADISANVYNVQKQILWEAADNNKIRNDIIENEPAELCSLETFVYQRVPQAFDYHVQTCKPEEICYLDLETPPTGDIYVNDRIFSSTLTTYNPIVVQLFFWYGTPHSPECYVEECTGFFDASVLGECAHLCYSGKDAYYLLDNGCGINDCMNIGWDSEAIVPGGKVFVSESINSNQLLININPPLTWKTKTAGYHNYEYSDDSIEDNKISIENTVTGCTFEIKKP